MAAQQYLAMALLISVVMMTQAAKRFYPEQRLDEEFTGKLSGYFSPQVMNKMMSILASNQKIRNNNRHLNSASSASSSPTSSSSLLLQPPPPPPQGSQPSPSSANNFRLMDDTDFEEERHRLKEFHHSQMSPTHHQRPSYLVAPKSIKMSRKQQPIELVLPSANSAAAVEQQQQPTARQNLIHLFHRFG